MKETSEQERTGQDKQNRTETGQTIPKPPARKKGRLPKTHQDYWLGRLRKRSYVDRDGKTMVEVPTWQVRLFHAGREGWFNLDTANQTAAAIKARDTYAFLRVNGWAPTLAKFKSGTTEPRLNLTVGQFLKAVNDTGHLRQRTFLDYQTRFRTIIGEAFGVKADKSRYDYRQGGNQDWRERVDAIRLDRVNFDRVTTWRQERIKAAGNSPTAIASAKRTANTCVRCARSLFTKEVIKRLAGIQLPSPLPFEGVEMFDSGSMKYVSKVNVQTLIAAARNELKSNEPEVYKAFLLGLFAGMRRAEIDLAEWGMVDWNKSLIRLEETQWLHLKTQDSAGEITIDAEVAAELRAFMPASKSQFIITSTRPPRNDSARAFYRCEPILDRLNEWLRSKGVTANKPLHEMRKEIGALIATEHGIYAASRFLRHSDIAMTARHYATHKTRISVGLGKLLDTEIKPAVEKATL